MVKNGLKIDVAVLNADLRYVKESQVALEDAFVNGMKEIRDELKDIKQLQGANRDEILVAKSGIKVLRAAGIAVISLITVGMTVYAALR